MAPPNRAVAKLPSKVQLSTWATLPEVMLMAPPPQAELPVNSTPTNLAVSVFRTAPPWPTAEFDEKLPPETYSEPLL